MTKTQLKSLQIKRAVDYQTPKTQEPIVTQRLRYQSRGVCDQWLVLGSQYKQAQVPTRAPERYTIRTSNS